MKKILGICLLSLTTIFFAKAQTSLNYLSVYHPLINTAENAVMAADYRAALEAYQKAFAKVPKGFMKDYFNAAVCATSLGDANLTYQYLLEVASKGVSLDFVRQETAFVGIQQDAGWKDFEKQYSEKKQLAESKTNKNLKDHLTKIVERDKLFHAQDAEVFADTIKKIDAQNARELDFLIAKYGFPNEESIGCTDDGVPIVQFPFYTIIRRQSAEYQTINFSNILLDAMRNGKIEPHFGTYLLASTSGEDVFFSHHVFKVTADSDAEIMKNKPFSPKLEKWLYRQLSVEEERNFDNLRLQNGLETMASYRKKIAFSLKDNRFLFPYKIFASIWYVADPNLASDFLADTALLE